MALLLELLNNPVVQSVLLAAIAGLGGVIGRALYSAWRTFRTAALHRLDETQMAIVDAIAAKAVRYVWQVMGSEAGQAKLAEASRILADQAAAKGINLTAEQIRVALEAALVDLKVQLGPIETPAIGGTTTTAPADSAFVPAAG